MQIKALGVLYPFPTKPLELGEQRFLKKEFGFVPGRDDLDFNDPDHVGAILFAAMREKNPEAPVNAVIKAINRVREVEIVGDDGKPLPDVGDESDDKSEEDPTLAGDAGR